MSAVKERAEAVAEELVRRGTFETRKAHRGTDGKKRPWRDACGRRGAIRGYLAAAYAETIAVLEGLVPKVCWRCRTKVPWMMCADGSTHADGGNYGSACDAKAIHDEITRLKAERDAK